MVKTPQTKIASKGTCNFCHDEFDKSKMTQHLKYCKQRAAMIKQTNARSEQKQRIFHLLVEGKYLPMYWMHLEMPAKATLEDLDNFLRAIWVECCDHLSEFKIGKLSFSSPVPDFGDITILGAPPDSEEGDVEEENEDEDEEAEEEGEEDNGLTLAEEIAMLTSQAKEVVEQISAEFPQGLASAKVEDIASLLHQRMLQEGKVMPADLETPEAQEDMMNTAYMFKFGMFVSSIEIPYLDQDMDYRLGKVLKVGDKFSYTYDFGSSTNLSCRVVAEREGAMTDVNEDDDEVVQILSRNEEPVIPCRECGKPATRIIPGYYSTWEGALCDTCKPKRDESMFSEEEFLPVVNSPRVGVCGYTGGNVWEGEEWDEDEEDELEADEDEE